MNDCIVYRDLKSKCTEEIICVHNREENITYYHVGNTIYIPVPVYQKLDLLKLHEFQESLAESNPTIILAIHDTVKTTLQYRLT